MAMMNVGRILEGIEEYEYEVDIHELGCYKREEQESNDDDKEEEEDFNSLFTAVSHVLSYTTYVAEHYLLGKNIGKVNLNQSKLPRINCSLHVLKRIWCAVTCEGERNDDPVGLIMNKILARYSWAEKAVVTVAAFALSYGELVLYVEENRKRNPFAMLISSLRGVEDIIVRVQKEPPLRAAITDLNEFTTLSLKFIGYILQLKDVPNSTSDRWIHDRTPILNEIQDLLQSYSFLAIRFVVQCMLLLNYLTYRRITTGKGLSSLASHLSGQIVTIKENIHHYNSRIESAVYSQLLSSIGRGHGIVEVMTLMMHPQQHLYRKHSPARVEKLEGKNVILFISRIENISEEDFNNMEGIHRMIKEEEHEYRIVWIPVMDREQRSAAKRSFEEWKARMPWYVVNYEASKPILGIKYIHETWQLSHNKPRVVLLDSSGSVKHHDAMHLIIKALHQQYSFFTTFTHTPPPHRRNMPPAILRTIKREVVIVEQIVEEEEHEIVYGGKDMKHLPPRF